MSNVEDLLSRIDSEFTALENKIKQFQAQQEAEVIARKQRLEQLEKVLEKTRDICRPRLEVLLKKFGDKVQVTPRVTESTREAVFEFKSKLAMINLRFSASTDRDVRKIVLSYDLRIIPVLTQYESHSEIEFPLDAVDTTKMAEWVDDRIVSFVRTYLSLHENEYYLQGHMVNDPISGVRFPLFAAAATVERDGHKYYFESEETKREFEAKK